MTYFMIHNSEDGVRIAPYDSKDALNREIDELTSEDIVPAARAQFIDFIPDDYTDTDKYLIIEGNVVQPRVKFSV